MKFQNPVNPAILANSSSSISMLYSQQRIPAVYSTHFVISFSSRIPLTILIHKSRIGNLACPISAVEAVSGS